MDEKSGYYFLIPIEQAKRIDGVTPDDLILTSDGDAISIRDLMEFFLAQAANLFCIFQVKKMNLIHIEDLTTSINSFMESFGEYLNAKDNQPSYFQEGNDSRPMPVGSQEKS